MTADWHRWHVCSTCGGRLLTVGAVTGHWLMRDFRRCRELKSGWRRREHPVVAMHTRWGTLGDVRADGR